MHVPEERLLLVSITLEDTQQARQERFRLPAVVCKGRARSSEARYLLNGRTRHSSANRAVRSGESESAASSRVPHSLAVPYSPCSRSDARVPCATSQQHHAGTATAARTPQRHQDDPPAQRPRRSRSARRATHTAWLVTRTRTARARPDRPPRTPARRGTRLPDRPPPRDHRRIRRSRASGPPPHPAGVLTARSQSVPNGPQAILGHPGPPDSQGVVGNVRGRLGGSKQPPPRRRNKENDRAPYAALSLSARSRFAST